MNTISILHGIACLIYLSLAVYVLFRNYRSLVNLLCALVMIAFAIWAFGLMFMVTAADKPAAAYWHSFSSFGWIGFAGVSLLFILALTRRLILLRKWFIVALILVFPAVFIHEQWAGALQAEYVMTPYGWMNIWSQSLWAYSYIAYYIICMGIILFLLNSARKAATGRSEKREMTIILTVTGISLVLASINDVILPNLKLRSFPPIAEIVTLIWGAGMAYAISRYSLMTVNMSIAASEIVSTIPDSLFVMDMDLKLIDVNEAICKLTGYTKRELIGKSAGIFFTLGENFFSGVWWEDLIKKGYVQDYDASLKTAEDEVIPVSASGSVVRDNNGEAVGVVCIAHDIRDELQIQEREIELVNKIAETEKERAHLLENAKIELEKKVAERTVELRMANEDLLSKKNELEKAYSELKNAQAKLIQSEKMAAIGQLAGGVAHEINNPMAVILGFSQLAARDVKEGDPLYVPLTSIEREAKRCRKLVGDLLTFSRTGKTEKESVNMDTIIDGVVSLTEAQAKVRNIKMERDYHAGGRDVLVNRSQMQQVIVNLSNNAMDAMPKGGIIKIATRQTEKETFIDVSDNGTGISPDIMKKIFEPFFTTKEIGKGTGLGLSLCYEIVQKHNGSIDVESIAGVGTTFHIKLPV